MYLLKIVLVKLFQILVLLCILIFVFTLLGIALSKIIFKPSNDRDWSLDQKVLPYAEFHSNNVLIHNIRNFDYLTTTEYNPAYYDKSFDLDKIKKVYYVVEPFSGIPGSAHTFLSFEFEGNQFVAISVEIRKEKGESYHPMKGLFNQYEIMYVIADERDVIKLRTNYRKDKVFLYPARTTKERARQLFLEMLKRANYLKDNPEFYNTLTNTCTTNIVNHINSIVPGRVPFFSLSILFPKNSDRLAYKLGLIDTELPFEEARKRYLINERAEKYADDPDFSVKIRQEY
jgi:hypothetical protein